jgi:hypothetical protein
VSLRRAAILRLSLRRCRKPGVVLRRPVGSDGPFREHADLPTQLAINEPRHRSTKTVRKPNAGAPRPTDDKAARKAALDFEREQHHRESQRRKEEAARERQAQRREQAVATAQAALEKNEREHDARVASIEAERVVLERKSAAEDARWAKEREKLERDLRRARE